MAIAGPCLSTMENPCSGITTSPESPTLLHTQNTRKGHTGRLVSLASHRLGQDVLINRHGQPHCSTWTEQSRMSSLPLSPCGLAIGRSLAAMHVPFPELTNLWLSASGETQPIPDSFLDGSAPRLRYFHLDGIPFPGLPNLLLYATHLV